MFRPDPHASPQEQLERLARLYEVSRAIHLTLEPQETLERILREAVSLTRADSGSVVLVNPTTGLLEIQAAAGLPPQADALRLRVGEGITGWVARTGQPARVGDVAADRRYIQIRPDVRSELAVPLEIEGEVRGVLNVDASRLEAFSAGDQELLEELAGQAARAIHHSWLHEQLRRKARQFESLAGVAQALNSSTGLDEVLQGITREACQLMGARLGSILLLDETGQWLDLKACHGAGPAYRDKPRLGTAESLMGVVVRRRKPLQESHVQTSGRYQHPEVARAEGLASLLAVPLLFGDRVLGTLNVYTAEPHVFSDVEIEVLTALAGLSAIAIEKARLLERLVATEDQLRQSEKLSVLGLLAAEIAHEIRNPLTVMKMLYHALDLKFPEGDERRQDARLLGEKMEHLNKIVERILDVARTAEPSLAPVSLPDLMDNLGLLIRHKLRQHQVALACQLPSDLPPVLADHVQLEQAFLNIILNALEAMPGGGTLTLRARVLSPSPEAPDTPAQVVVEFVDTGEGMTAAQQRRMFSSLLGSEKRGGTGLGLAIVRRILEAHRGSIEVQSRSGHGTTVALTLPAAALP